MAFSYRRKSAGEDQVLPAEEKRRRFESLAIPLIDPLFNFACSLARDHAQAEDLVQETYMKAWNGYDAFRGESTFRTWIFRMLRNAFLSSQKDVRTSRVEQLDEEQHEDFLPRTSETPESILLGESHLSMVREALEEMPVLMREILILREVEEMSYQAISAILEIPIGTVMSRLARARRTLRESALSKLGGGKK